MLGINTGLSVSQGCQSVIFHIHREQVLPFKIRNTVNRNSSLIKAYFSTWKKIKKSRKSPSPHLEPYSTSQAMSKEYKVKSESLSLEEGKRSTQVSVKDMMAYGSWINWYNTQCYDSVLDGKSYVCHPSNICFKTNLTTLNTAGLEDHKPFCYLWMLLDSLPDL